MPAKLFLCPDRERGAGLVEAMVSIAILAIAVLGIGVILTGSWRVITETELDVNHQQEGMHTEAFGATLSPAKAVSMPVVVPGSGGGSNSNPLVTVANPVSLIPVDNLLTLSIGAGTGVTSSTESVQYGVIRNGVNQWWIP
ncbi:hypothetical protein GGI1_11678 [Acidithiobacillus sp. GGI-221]|nr:hypothetical protein GGI1_11678 [Acidithiobacillus sp. GGI-221]